MGEINYSSGSLLRFPKKVKHLQPKPVPDAHVGGPVPPVFRNLRPSPASDQYRPGSHGGRQRKQHPRNH